MAEPAGIFGAFEPVDIPHAAAAPPPKYSFGMDALGAGWKGGSAGTDYGLHQAAYEGDVFGVVKEEAKKRGIAAPPYVLSNVAMYERRVKAAGGNLDVLNVLERRAYDQSHQFWDRLNQERQKDPTFLKDLPVFDADSLQAEARRRREVDEGVANEIYAQSTTGGKAAWWVGSFGTAVKDPLSYLPLGGAAKVETTVGLGIIKGVGRGAAINAGTAVALEPFTRLDAAARGQERTLKDTAIDVGISAAFGGLLEGAHGGLAAKFGAHPDVQAAEHVVARDAEIRSASPFHPTPAGDAEHGTRLAATITALEAGKPVPKFKTRLQSTTSLASVGGGEAQFRAHVEGAEGTAKNPLSTAKGHFQFTRDTWLSYYKREIGAGKLTDAEILAKRTDKPTADKLFTALTADNKVMLKAAGLPDSATNLYMAHFLGPKALRVLRAAPETPVENLLPHEFITANPRVLRGKTAGEVIAWADRKMGGEGVVVEAPDTPLLREEHFADEGEYREALTDVEHVPESGPDFALADNIGTLGRDTYLQTHGGLWRRSADELDSIYERAKLSEAAQLHGAIEKIGLTPSKRLSDLLESESFNWDRAAARIEKEAAEAGLEVPPDADRVLNPRWDDAPSSDLPMSEDVAELQKAHANAAGDDRHWLASELGWALRDLNADEIRAVLEGKGTIKAQAAMTTLRLGFVRMGELGITGDKIPAEIAGAMVRNGVPPATADELTRLTLDALREGGPVQQARPEPPSPEPLAITDQSAPNENIPDQVVREIEAEGPHFVDPNGPDAIAQVDSIEHDLSALVAEDLGDTANFRIAEEGKEITVADALENIARDEAAIKAVKDCL